jgi:hypothetical protein
MKFSLLVRQLHSTRSFPLHRCWFWLFRWAALFLSEETIVEQIQFMAGDFLDDSTIQSL